MCMISRYDAWCVRWVTTVISWVKFSLLYILLLNKIPPLNKDRNFSEGGDFIKQENVLKTQFLGHLIEFLSESGCQRVWKSKNRYVCTFGRLGCVLMMIWSWNFFSAQRYDPKQVSQSWVWCAESHKNFFRAIQSQTVGYSKHNFWVTSETSLQNQVARGYENPKIATFARFVA